MKLGTINQVVEAILEMEDGNIKITTERIANEATIYLKTALICENTGIDEAMEYFTGTHSDDEFQEFRTGVTGGEE